MSECVHSKRSVSQSYLLVHQYHFFKHEVVKEFLSQRAPPPLFCPESSFPLDRLAGYLMRQPGLSPETLIIQLTVAKQVAPMPTRKAKAPSKVPLREAPLV